MPSSIWEKVAEAEKNFRSNPELMREYEESERKNRELKAALQLPDDHGYIMTDQERRDYYKKLKQETDELWKIYKESEREVARWKLRDDAFESDEWYQKFEDLKWKAFGYGDAYSVNMEYLHRLEKIINDRGCENGRRDL